VRQLIISVFLVVFASAAFAQKGNPAAPGKPARATDVATLAAALDDISDRLSRLEGRLTVADVAGTYSFVGLEVEVGRGCSGECLPDITHHASQNGVLTLNSDMTFVLNATDSSAKIRIDLRDGGTNNARLFTTTTLTPSLFQAGGSWSLSGKVVTLNLPGESAKTLLSAGPNLLVNAVKSDDGTDHSLIMAVRQ
jgi:hypothetical protein